MSSIFAHVPKKPPPQPGGQTFTVRALENLPDASLVVEVEDEIYIRTIRQLAEQKNYKWLSRVHWYPVDTSDEDPGETETSTREVVFEIVSVDPISVARRYLVRTKTPEEVDKSLEEAASGGRKANLSAMLQTIQNRSDQHAAWAAQGASVTQITEANRDAVIMALVNRQVQADTWFSQLYARFGDLLRYLGFVD